MAFKKNTKKRNFKNDIKVAVNCQFCNTGTNPDYKNYKDLDKFLSDRARILGKARTGICSKHQRALGVEIKRARFLGLLPFSPTI